MKIRHIWGGFAALVAGIATLSACGPAAAADIYVAQSSNGVTNSLAWLNSNYVWTPGDVIHLVGTLTNSLTIGGSGTAANPITIYFEPGAQFVAPYWPMAINLYNQAYITIDGGVNGLITATNNGTLLGFTNQTCGIYANSISGGGVEIKNLTLSNLFFRVPLPDGDARNSQPTIQAIYLGLINANNVYVHNNTLIQAGNAISINYGGNCTNIIITNNVISDVSFGVNLNCNGAGFATGFSISHNVCSNFSTYDGNWGLSSGQHNHNNFLIISSSAAATNDNLLIEGNWAGGKNGQYMSSLIKITPDHYVFSNAKIINNVLVNTETNANITNGHISVSDSMNTLIANNTIINTGGAGASTTGIKIGGDGDFCPAYIYNNLFYGVSKNVATDIGLTNILMSDYNVIRADIADSAFYGQGYTFQTIADWVAHNSGFEIHSKTTVPRLSFTPPTYAPLSNDRVASGNGTNLANLGILNDFYGNRRPSGTTNWTIGAIENTNLFSSSIQPPAKLYTPVLVSTH